MLFNRNRTHYSLVKFNFQIFRYTGIGVNSFGKNPDVFAKITPDVKEWIDQIAQIQTSNCFVNPGITKSGKPYMYK